VTEFQLSKELGARALVTRDQGARALGKLDRWVLARGVLRIRLDDVDAMSPSFTDEFFGGLVDKVGLEAFNELVRVSGGDSSSRLLIERVVGAHLAKRRSRSGH